MTAREVPGDAAGVDAPAARSRSWPAVVAWGHLGLVTVVSIWGVVAAPVGERRQDLAWAVILVAMTSVGAFIIHRRRAGAVGWLLLVPGLAVWEVSLADLVVPPEGEVTAGLVVALLVTSLSWLPVFFSVILLLALFPTGRPLSPGWRWHTRAVLAMAAVLVGWATFSRELGPHSEEGTDERIWTVANPIGFLPGPETVPWFAPAWNVALAAITLSALVALILRFHRAGPTQRQQLKWLLAAFSVFALAYTAAIAVYEHVSGVVVDVLFLVGLLSIPVAIAVAILRHRLFDIDVVIRRTLVYALVAGVLGTTYLGSVMASESVLRGVVGVDSSLGVAASTLLVAALFAPVRRWVRDLVARRFYRSPYDARVIIAQFGDRIRDRTDVGALTRDLVRTVATTLQPRTLGLWLQPDPAVRGPTAGSPDEAELAGEVTSGLERGPLAVDDPRRGT